MLAAVLALATVAAVPALAKCPFADLAFTGTVRDAANGTPVADAKVLIFLENAVQPLPVSCSDTGVPITDVDGGFSVSARFDTFKRYGRLRGHNCSHRPTTASVVVVAEGYTPIRRKLELEEKIMERGPLDFVVRLVPFEITRDASFGDN
jgi:hypothetical protein